MRKMVCGIFLLFMMPRLAAGQTAVEEPVPRVTDGDRPHRLSVQVAAGGTIRDGGNVQSASIGYSPTSRLTVLLNAERSHIPARVQRYADGGYSASRGGTVQFISGEARLAFLPASRVSPYGTAGFGVGRSHPNVNAIFPDRVTNTARVIFAGGGIHVPLARYLNLFGDVRFTILGERDSVSLLVPVRAGIALWF